MIRSNSKYCLHLLQTRSALLDSSARTGISSAARLMKVCPPPWTSKVHCTKSWSLSRKKRLWALRGKSLSESEKCKRLKLSLRGVYQKSGIHTSAAITLWTMTIINLSRWPNEWRTRGPRSRISDDRISNCFNSAVRRRSQTRRLAWWIKMPSQLTKKRPKRMQRWSSSSTALIYSEPLNNKITSTTTKTIKIMYLSRGPPKVPKSLAKMVLCKTNRTQEWLKDHR